MASSRVFIKGLPPTLSEADFRKHFAQNGRDITDAKIFQNRRIGYIGYKTPEDAQKAVKYFNKTFMRMSRIGVEIARPVKPESEHQTGRGTPTARREPEGRVAEAGMKRKREGDSGTADKDDPKLKEFMEVMKPKSKKRVWEDEAGSPLVQDDVDTTSRDPIVEVQSDDEYESVPKKSKRPKSGAKEEVAPSPEEVADVEVTAQTATSDAALESTPQEEGHQPAEKISASDADWARSRTSRLLGLLDDDEEKNDSAPRKENTMSSDSEDDGENIEVNTTRGPIMPEKSIPTPPADEQTTRDETGYEPDEQVDATIEAVRSSMRLFVRNLPYGATEEDLEAEFAIYGNLEEVHIPLDKQTSSTKGFAYLQFSDADSAEAAFTGRDGETFQGRLLHILPARVKPENKLDEFALSKLPLKKQQQIRRRREAASTTFNWNSLYLNQDAVISSVANSLGIAKSDVLDPTSSDAAVRQAHAETHIIQETKAFFQEHGVDLDAFKRSARGDESILVKNIPYDCSRDELERLFGEHGEVKRFLMPPSGIIAIIAFANEGQCKTAFGALAYRKIKGSVLFLEKAPKGLFDANPATKQANGDGRGVVKASATDLKDNADSTVQETAGSATLFVRNLNFSTTTPQLTNTFKHLSGFLSGRVKTKTDPKKPGQVLSMGFGFVEFTTTKDAQSALRVMDGHTLEGHKLQVRASHKGADAAEERRKQDAAKKSSGKKTKIIIKNLPFEADKKDIRSLFGAYGQLRSVRVPKKMDRGARGFAFADFTTAKEAENAMHALRDTHLLGRRLVLDFTEAEPENAEEEIERMSKKVGAQVDRVRVQNMIDGGKRKRVRLGEEPEEE